MATRPAFFAWAFAAVLFFLLVALFSGTDSSQLSVEKDLAKTPTSRSPYASVEEVRKELAVEESETDEEPVLVQPTYKPSPQSEAKSYQEADQRVEELIKARVARATKAVLGSRPPPQAGHYSAPTSNPREVQSRPRPASAAAPHSVGPPAVVAKKAPVAAAAASPPSAPEPAQLEGSAKPLSEQNVSLVDLDRLLAAFATAYQSRDAAAFAVLFTPNAYTPDASGQKAIRSLYAEFFAANEVREFIFDSTVWSGTAGTVRVGTAETTITTAPVSGGEASTVETTISFQVSRYKDGSVKISRMTY